MEPIILELGDFMVTETSAPFLIQLPSDRKFYAPPPHQNGVLIGTPEVVEVAGREMYSIVVAHP